MSVLFQKIVVKRKIVDISSCEYYLSTNGRQNRIREDIWTWHTVLAIAIERLVVELLLYKSGSHETWYPKFGWLSGSTKELEEEIAIVAADMIISM